MRKITTAAIACLGLFASSASAQTVPDDVRCFLLSNIFAKQEKNPKPQQAAAASLTFYLGRLDGKADAATIASTIRHEGPALNPKTAGTQMTACVARMAHSQQALQAAIRATPPAK